MQENKQIIINNVDVSECSELMTDLNCFKTEWHSYRNGDYTYEKCSDHPECCYKKVMARLTNKEKEYEELRQYHNKCCQEFEKEKQNLIDKYNQLSRDFYSGKYCNTEKCELLNDKQKDKNQIKFEIYQELLTILNSTAGIYKNDSLDIRLQAGLEEAIFRLVKETMIGDEDV